LYNDQIKRIYLNELGDIRQQPIGLALMLLTVIPKAKTPQEAKFLVDSAKTREFDSLTEKEIINSVITIMMYKFTTVNREVIEAMLGVSIEESRVYQEAEEAGRAKGRQEGRQEGERGLVIRLLHRKLGTLPKSTLSQIEALSLPELEELGEALLDFSAMADLESWLLS
jgi:predicted transposase YdaD